MQALAVMMKQREIELKLSIDEDIYKALCKALESVGETQKQTNIFFDSKENVLQKNKWALRLRHENQKSSLTAKGPSIPKNGVFDREEVEIELAKTECEHLENGFDLQESNFEPCQFLANSYGNLKLVEFLRFNNSRSKLKWNGFVLEIDHSQVKNVDKYELEIETEASRIELLQSSLISYFKENNWEFIPSEKSKLEWALENC
jgi:uncharacterized protein YjbK